jgi:tripartite-type tricarboxylate transporter receptor subunit TctC
LADLQVWIVVPFPAGSTPDLLARAMAERLSAKLGQQFLIENKPGAGGMIGTDLVAKAEPDGYRIGVSITGPLVNNTLLYKKMLRPVHRSRASELGGVAALRAGRRQ